MKRNRPCQPCDMGHHGRCRDPHCTCCGDFEEPEAPMEADPEGYDREEDARLSRQFGAWDA